MEMFCIVIVITSWSQVNGTTVPVPVELTEVTLQRETILLSPVFSAVIHHASPSGQDMKTGYVRLSAFSQVFLQTFSCRFILGLRFHISECKDLEIFLVISILGDNWMRCQDSLPG